MKKNIFRTLQLIVAASLFLSAVQGCSKKEDLRSGEDVGRQNSQNEITISVKLSEDSDGNISDTKVTYNDKSIGNSGQRSLTWSANDKIVVAGYDASGKFLNKSVFTIESGVGMYSAKFKGVPPFGTQFRMFYPADVLFPDNHTIESIPSITGLENQTQSGNNSSEHLSRSILVYSDATSDINNFLLNVKSCIMRFKLTGIPSDLGTIKELRWVVQAESGTYKTKLHFGEDKPIRLTSPNDTLIAFISFMPENMSIVKNGIFTVTLIGDKLYEATVKSTNGKIYSAGKRYTAEMKSFVETEVFKPNYRYGFETLNSSNDVAIYNYIGSRLKQVDSYYTLTSMYRAIQLDFASIGQNDMEDGATLNPENATFQRFVRFLKYVYDDFPELYFVNLIPRMDNSGKWIVRGVEASMKVYKSNMELIEKNADLICNEAMAVDDEFEKLRLIHDKFLPITYAIAAANASTIVGGLIERRAVCEGFARTMLYLCQRVGLKAVYVNGELNTSGTTWINHAWNYVKVDGLWYLLDATSDNGMAGGRSGYSNFLLGKKDAEKVHRLNGSSSFDLPEISAINHPKGDELRRTTY